MASHITTVAAARAQTTGSQEKTDSFKNAATGHDLIIARLSREADRD